MFEREIQFIHDFSHNQVKKLGSFITFSELESTDLHPAIIQYISAEIDFYIFEDRQKLLKDSLFDYSGDRINSYFMQISDEIKKVKKFSQSYIEKLILHSVTFTVNHLVSPNSLISQFIFEEDKEKSAAEIKQILNYLYYYPHINKIISSYLDKKNLTKINSEEFENLLKKIDRIGLEANTEKIYNEALESMAEFFNIGMSGRVLIPLVAVQNYLKDKGLNNHLDKLQSEFINAEVTRYEIKDYQKVINGLDITELKPVRGTETEEVLESDLANDSLHSQSFEPVEEVRKPIKIDESPVDINITENESGKVILDDEPVADVDKDLKETSEDKDEEVLEDSPKADSEIVEIEDERELANEAVAEVMELAKEEVKITADEDSTNEDLDDEEESKELYAGEKVNEADEDSPEENKLTEEMDVSEDEPGIKEIVDTEKEKEVISYIDDDEGDAVKFEKETIPGSETLKPEIDDSPEQNEDIKDEELSDSGTESIDTLSYLLNEDSAENKMETESAEDEMETDSAEDEMEIESAEDENLNEDKKEIESDEEPVLFEEGEKKDTEEEESETGLDEEKANGQGADNESVVEEKKSPTAFSHLDVVSLLENKKITKIIDVIFDYDMEEFATAIEQIGEAPNIYIANSIIDKVCKSSQISVSSKEAKLFKSIISDYYDRK